MFKLNDQKVPTDTKYWTRYVLLDELYKTSFSQLLKYHHFNLLAEISFRWPGTCLFFKTSTLIYFNSKCMWLSKRDYREIYCIFFLQNLPNHWAINIRTFNIAQPSWGQVGAMMGFQFYLKILPCTVLTGLQIFKIISVKNREASTYGSLLLIYDCYSCSRNNC